MPSLSKNAKPLLRMVDGKPHATDDDHEQEMKKQRQQKVKDTNIERDPESSHEDDGDDDDDGDGDTQFDEWKRKPKNQRKQVRPPKRTGAAVEEKKPSVQQKRQHDSEDEREKTVFAASQEPKSKKRSTFKTFSRKPSSQSSQSSSQPTAQTKGQIRKPNLPPAAIPEPKSKPGLIAPPSGASVPTSSQPESTRIFRRPAGFTETSAPPNSTQTSTHSQPPLSQLCDASSPLSSINEYDLEDLEEPMPEKTEELISRTAPCPICGEQIEKSFHHTFETDICRGRRMNLRLQEKFCKAHKARNAKSDWNEKGYPSIDWPILPERLKTHHDHLRAVMDGTFESPFRKESEDMLKTNKTNSVAQSWNSDGFHVLRTGYYGTKGEKIMSEHIVRCFSSKLRTLSATDKLIAARGVSGGVSGYVHAVLVPELAVKLIEEDMGCGREKAVVVLTESAELGEIFNEEEDENVSGRGGEVEDDGDGGGGGYEGGGYEGGGSGSGSRDGDGDQSRRFRRPSIVID